MVLPGGGELGLSHLQLAVLGATLGVAGVRPPAPERGKRIQESMPWLGWRQLLS